MISPYEAEHERYAKQQKEKELIQKYRDLVSRMGIEDLKVNRFGGIQICEDGAFVECTLFISSSKL